jgi:hypothetical protein
MVKNLGVWGPPRDARRLEALGFMEVPQQEVRDLKRWLTRLGVRHLGRRSRLHDLWIESCVYEVWQQDSRWPGLLDVRAVIEWSRRGMYIEIVERHVCPCEDCRDIALATFCAGGLRAFVEHLHWVREGPYYL